MIVRNFEAGEVILIDKPYTWTSFDVVKKIRNAIKIKKIGHAGTLDPLATGLLILCTGKMTKQIEKFMAKEKEYTGTLVIGKTTPSIDLETDIDSENDISNITTDQVYAAVQSFHGEISQIPPVYSAIKVDGERVYMKARAGEQVELKPRIVEIKEFSISKIEFPVLHFKVICSKGTYIRSLVRDYGKLLGVGAYMTSLRRTRIGEHKIEDAYSLESFLSEVKKLN
ncbi:MAG: tRNA pseudouridine(55) synthase TruB [Bacteroidota bacterium]|jgi:tRNA pseudouridine55 synthase|nr:tRNA pseudouridine(55) synthase TruB [Bacteroidota bacterium]